MMTKKDFIALADRLRPTMQMLNDSDDAVRVIDSLVGFMRSNNYRFNEQRWRAYLDGECGPNGGKLK